MPSAPPLAGFPADLAAGLAFFDLAGFADGAGRAAAAAAEDWAIRAARISLALCVSIAVP